MLSTTPQPGSGADAWDEIEQLIREAAEQARADLSPAEFHAALLDRAVRGLAAMGGAVWILVDGRPVADAQIRLVDVLPANEADQEQHRRLIAAAFEHPHVRLIPPSSTGLDGAGNPTSCVLLHGPIVVSDQVTAIVEVFQRSGASPGAQQGFLHFLAALCELGAEHGRSSELRELRAQAAVWRQFEDFTVHVHSSLHLRVLSSVAVNEGRRVIECDRLSLLTCRGRTCRVEAISGLDALDRRANAVRTLQRLADAVTVTGEPLWFEGQSVDLAPQIERALELALPESRARMLAVIPLIDRQESGRPGLPVQKQAVGALIVEQFDQSRASGPLRHRTTAIARQLVPALKNALEVETVPAYGILKSLGAVTLAARRRLPAIASIGAAVVVLALALWLIPADFTVESFGELQPEVRRDVFAPDDGIVSELLVKPAQDVTAGQILATLQSSRLDFEFSRVLGEKATVNQKLATIRAAQLKTADETDAHKLAAEEGELKVQLESLQQQQEILEQQRAELKLRSPIDGRVLTWDPSRELTARPVQRGDRLLTVADLDSQWQVEMQVPDHAIGHVLEAQRQQGPALEVTFLLASDPGQTYRGTVVKVASNAEIHQTEGPCVKVTVNVTDPIRTAFRPGARVIPRIACGRRPLGYVWLHDVIDAVRTRLLF